LIIATTAIQISTIDVTGGWSGRKHIYK